MGKKLQDISKKEAEYGYYRSAKISRESFLKMCVWGLTAFVLVVVLNFANVFSAAKDLQEEVSVSTIQGFEMLLSGGQNTSQVDLKSAEEAFQLAERSFEDLEGDLWFVSINSNAYGTHSDLLRSAKLVTQSGSLMAEAGKNFLLAVEELADLPAYFLHEGEGGNGFVGLTDKLAASLVYVEKSIDLVDQAGLLIEKINVDSIPGHLQEKVASAQGMVESFRGSLKEAADYFPALLTLLGHERPHRYLVILQNNNEIRATGGFIGSYLLVEVDKGEMTSFRVEDVYHLPLDRTSPTPEHMHWVSDQLHFRDSNYSIDFPSSGEKMIEMFEYESDKEVDTLVALNQSSLERFLEVTGGVEVENVGVFDKDNYNLLLTYIIESKVYGWDDPKEILRKLVAGFREKAANPSLYDEFVSIIYDEVNKKNMLAYSKDEQVEGFFEFLDVSGEVNDGGAVDFLAVVNSSIGGTKSDHFIEETIDHVSVIDDLGKIHNTVTVSRKHLWNETFLDYWLRVLADYGVSDPEDYVLDIMGRGRNKNVVKVYVPKDVKLVEKSMAEVVHGYDPDLDKDYFVFVMEVNAGEEQKVRLEYELESSADKGLVDYSLFVAKQPGSRGSLLNKTVRAGDFERVSIYPEEYSVVNEDEINYYTNLVYDRYFSVVLSR